MNTNKKSISMLTERSFYSHTLKFGKDLVAPSNLTTYRAIVDKSSFQKCLGDEIVLGDETQSFKTN